MKQFKDNSNIYSGKIDRPSVSIIVCIYNVAEYLCDCLESIENQTFRDFEVLLINDGSTDNCGKICENFSRRDNRFITIHQKNAGVSAAHNTGLKLCQGRYISMIDGDDYIHPEMIKELFMAIESGDYDFSMAWGKDIYEKIDTFPTLTIKTKILDRNYIINRLYSNSYYSFQYSVLWNKLYKRELIEDLFLKKMSSQDLEYNNLVFLKTKKAILIDETLYYWVQRMSSITHTKYSLRNINIINSYYVCLHEIPKENIKYRAYCLTKLYKSLLSIRFFAKKTEYADYAIEQITKISKLTYREFLFNRRINLYCKLGLLIFYHIPITYKIFVKINELKLKKTIK